MTTRSVGREAAGWRQVERAQQAGRHRIRYWNQVGFGSKRTSRPTAKRNMEAGDRFEPRLCAATRNLGDKVEIRIRDNGSGIPIEIREKIFNPFFTTKPAGEGTGLGLSMSHDIIVKQHGGTIDVETQLGQFTEFRIILPRTSPR